MRPDLQESQSDAALIMFAHEAEIKQARRSPARCVAIASERHSIRRGLGLLSWFLKSG